LARPSPDVAEARAHLRAGDAEAALRGLDAALVRATEGRRAELLWLKAAALAAGGADPRPVLDAIARSDHPLARWATLRLAERLPPAEVVARLAPLAAEDWAGTRRATLAVAKAYAALDRWDRAAPELRALVASTPERIGGASAAMPLAAHLATSDDPAAREEALALYRRVASRAPRARVGREARERAGAVLATLPRERRRALRALPPEDRFAEARALAGSQHHRDAAAAFAALAEDLLAGDALRCRAELAQGEALLKARERATGAPLLEGVVERCADPDVRAWAGYRAARARARLGERDRALAGYATVAANAPDHRLADDALFQRARLLREEGDAAGAAAAFEAVLRDHPQGDMVDEAVFQLARDARRRGDHPTALGWLERGLRAGARETTEGIAGRLAYWRARSLEALARRDEALAAYEDVLRTEPLAFYAQLALARLRAAAPERAAAIEAWLREGPEEGSLTFPMRAEFRDPAFVRALVLLRVGAIDEAEKELAAVGFTGAGADPDALWAAAAVLAESGALPAAARLVRRRLGVGFRRTLPRGDARALWRLAYPSAFAPLIEETAGEVEVPASLLRAVAREESSFDPDAVSWAHAYGLVQVILPTAQRFGADLGVPITPRTLRRPEVNLAVGARYVAFLQRRYAGQPGLVPAAYNAGHGAVDRWLRQRGEMPFDEYVEAIPYDETRRYTRRVLQSWGIYGYLDEDALPALPLTLPPRG
ncbi:MAG: lytic transglycosylase domain-containing protein, partial [Myxococcota bacterium]